MIEECEEVNIGIIRCCRCSCVMGETVRFKNGEDSTSMHKKNLGPFHMNILNSVTNEIIELNYNELCAYCHNVLLGLFEKAGPSKRGQGRKIAKEKRELELKLNKEK